MVNTICCIYGNCLLMMNSYSVRNIWRRDYLNKLREKSASCWSLLRRYETLFITNVKEQLSMASKASNLFSSLFNFSMKMCSNNNGKDNSETFE